MGTSKSYSDVTKRNMPNWPELSSVITRTCDGTTPTSDRLTNILNGYVTAVGGSNSASASNSSNNSRRRVQSTAKNIASLLSIVSRGGSIRDVLRSTGVTSNLDGKTVEEIINHLIEFCSGPGATVDDRAAKQASRILLEELMQSATSIDDIDVKLADTFQEIDLEDVIIKYFGYYIYEHLSIWFYDHLIKKNQSDCESLFGHLRSFILERLRQLNKTNPLTNINWGSPAADQVIANIQTDVLTVFE